MKTVLTLIVLGLLLPGAACAGSAEQVDWSTIQFESLTSNPDGTKRIAGGYVAMAIQVLSEPPDSDYAKKLEAGLTWSCIAMTIDAMIDHLSLSSMMARDTTLVGPDSPYYPMDPDSTGENSIFGFHSGQRWRFWQYLAHVGVLAYERGLDVSLGPETARILGEMEYAFSELLDPKDAEFYFFGGNLPEDPPGGGRERGDKSR